MLIANLCNWSDVQQSEKAIHGVNQYGLILHYTLLGVILQCKTLQCSLSNNQVTQV